MKYYLILLYFFLSHSLFSQISLPTFHATQNVKSVVNNFQVGDPLIVAGGGGGVIYQVNPHSGMHASISAITQILPSYAGLNLTKEVFFLLQHYWPS